MSSLATSRRSSRIRAKRATNDESVKIEDEGEDMTAKKRRRISTDKSESKKREASSQMVGVCGNQGDVPGAMIDNTKMDDVYANSCHTDINVGTTVSDFDDLAAAVLGRIVKGGEVHKTVCGQAEETQEIERAKEAKNTEESNQEGSQTAGNQQTNVKEVLGVKRSRQAISNDDTPSASACPVSSGESRIAVELRDPSLTALNDCIEALLYQDGAFRSLTHSTLKLLEDTKARVGEVNALFLEGLHAFGRQRASFKYFLEAEEKGCTHPVLYFFMGDCFDLGLGGIEKNAAKALEYYTKSIEGGCPWGYGGIHKMYCVGYDGVESDDVKAFTYLLNLDVGDIVDGFVLTKIGECYQYGIGCDKSRHAAIRYYQRAIYSGYRPAGLNVFNLLGEGNSGFTKGKYKIACSLLKNELEATHSKEDRLLGMHIDMLLDPDYVRTFVPAMLTMRGQLALSYCNDLIQRGSPKGYSAKGWIYALGKYNIPEDWSQAVSIWDEADRLGLADTDAYYGLQRAYIQGKGAPANGLKVLEYGEKALQITMDDYDWLRVSESMGEVYTIGVHPVSQNGSKVLEWYERALSMVISSNARETLYLFMSQVYEEGIPPIAKDLKKADELERKSKNLLKLMTHQSVKSIYQP